MIPNCQRMNRGNYVMSQLVHACKSNDVTDLLIVHEHRGEPSEPRLGREEGQMLARLGREEGQMLARLGREEGQMLARLGREEGQMLARHCALSLMLALVVLGFVLVGKDSSGLVGWPSVY